MQSDQSEPVNIGRPEYVSVDDLVNIVADVAGKDIRIKHVPGPVGVQSRNFSNQRIYNLGWESRVSLKEGIEKTYPWVSEQLHKATS